MVFVLIVKRNRNEYYKEAAMKNDDLRQPYQCAPLPGIELGGIMLDDTLLEKAPVNLVLKSLSRHGLIAGATGSGKTKSIQVICEQLSLAGIPTLVMDIKGDISGLAQAGVENDMIRSRCEALKIDFTPTAFPVEFMTLNDSLPGLPLRATISDFGAVLFARMLDLNETQAGVVTIVFEYAKLNQIPLVDLDDFKSLLQYAQSDAGKADIEKEFGGVASSTIGTIMRKLIELDAQGGDSFFAQPAFAVNDLLRTNADGKGIISILRLQDMQDKPKLFSSFMLKLLTDVYRQFPEIGDMDKPKLILFIDEAHLIFNEASKALLNLIETIVKLIRSKGVGLVFSTQSPDDVPNAVLSQLGFKIQHALRAFTAKDRQAIRLVAQNFPPSTYYNTEQLLTALGIGEALVTTLDAKGQPTPLVECLIRPPESRMGVLSDAELKTIVSQSTLYPRYAERVKSGSAEQVLAARLPTIEQPSEKAAKAESVKKTAEEATIITRLSKNTLFRQIIRQVFRQLIDQIMRAFGLKKR